MRLKNLVGRKAIRTGEMVRSVFDVQRRCMVNIGPTPTQIAKYTDKPVAVIAVEGCQIVIEESNGERKLLPREYDDDFWTDYEKLMHPEEEMAKKAQALLDELDLLAEPLKDFLRENFDPMCQVVIDMDGACVTRSEMGTGKNGKGYKRVD